MINKYSAKISFTQGEKPLLFSVKAFSEIAARRNVNALLNKLGKRATGIEIKAAS